MAKITLVGDVHAKLEEYQQILADHPEPVIQVGDLGCGFVNVPKFANQHKFIRGNHDDPAAARIHHNYLGDYGYIEKYKMFYMSGAYSIDFQYRQIMMARGASPCWWPDEELPPAQLTEALSMYLAVKPRIVVSHEVPTVAGLVLLQMEQKRLYKTPCTDSRTAAIMQAMLDRHQPELWVFGHYHFSRSFMLDKTRFLCLNELEAFELDTENPLGNFYGDEIQENI